ncbi:MAG: DNA repair protein RecO, partial [Aquificae bacterium]|nr:DNA repair protein RecO [Aquificota bacterium]
FTEKLLKFFIKEINQFQNLALPISQNLDKFYTAFYILSIFNKYSISDDEKLFILLKKSFYYLTIIENTENFKINFLAKFILLSGIYPQLDECVKCKSKINVKNFSSFSVKHSGVICKNCNKRKKSFLTYKDILTLKALKKAPFSKIDSLYIENKNFLHFFEKYISSKMES